MKKYQVFISSTYSDLRAERKEIFQCLISANYIVSGMEYFPSAGIKQFEYIKRVIDDSDYYILIVSGRYGSINSSTGISYTELEYDYAVKTGKNLLIFINEEYKRICRENGNKDIERLENFVKKIQNNILCKYWISTSELVASVLVSLGEAQAINPASGWTKVVTDTSILSKRVEDLEKENIELKQNLENANREISQGLLKREQLASANDKYVIRGEYSYVFQSRLRTDKVLITKAWDDIFDAVGPFLFSSVNVVTFEKQLLEGLKAKDVSIRCSKLNIDSVQTIKLQLAALGLIHIFEAKSTNGGMSEFVKMTEFGKTYLFTIKTIKR